QPYDRGYWALETKTLTPGSRYRFSIDGNDPLPDPASLAQPGGVHGASQAVDLSAFQWSDGSWRNHALQNYILYELHTGTFSPDGTFAGIESRLDHLVDLGVTAIEIMPVAQFPGERNWGYDGVYPFAAQHSYGGAEGLQRLVDACHQKGIAVVLDVVYNHLGPEGNYLGTYGPYFTDKYKTPWGHALNFDDAGSDGVRHYFIENALMWLRDFHVDALRLDAVHAIKDFSAVHLLRELRQAVDALEEATGRKHYLIVESDLNDHRFINPPEKGGYGMDAQWIDEFHHALRVTATGEKTGYYADFSGIAHLAKTYRDAYVYDGQYSPHRDRTFGIPATGNEGRQFVVFSQNHDQVGNRMLGERTSSLVSFEMQKLLAGAVMLSPYVPMLFMGEEWAEPAPFLYFVSHTDPDLAEAVRQGRKSEFAAFHAEGEAPDPMSVDTFAKSRLQWDLRNEGQHRIMLSFYKELLVLRRSDPVFSHLDRSGVSVETRGAGLLILRRWAGERARVCFLNFSKHQELATANIAKDLSLVFDSAAEKWSGGHVADEQVSNGQPVSIAPESFLIYSHSNA
ncbi:MAG: malto-oligosyltrehalose trehalohydrolase, partial [Flaviaesturariibacter sp.]|nr:malto-oligosyltrehalose trehalohydrolase [Flaviaesturariibacter sp.]